VVHPEPFPSTGSPTTNPSRGRLPARRIARSTGRSGGCRRRIFGLSGHSPTRGFHHAESRTEISSPSRPELAFCYRNRGDCSRWRRGRWKAPTGAKPPFGASRRDPPRGCQPSERPAICNCRRSWCRTPLPIERSVARRETIDRMVVSAREASVGSVSRCGDVAAGIFIGSSAGDGGRCQRHAVFGGRTQSAPSPSLATQRVLELAKPSR